MAKPVVIVVGADKGGVGKTTVSRTVLDYFSANNVPTRAFDTEAPRGTETAAVDDTYGKMALMDRLIVHDGIAKVIDLGFHAYDEFFTMSDEIGFMKEAARRSVAPVVLFLADTDRVSARSHATLRQQVPATALVTIDNEYVMRGELPEAFSHGPMLRIAALPVFLKTYIDRLNFSFTDYLRHEKDQSTELHQWIRRNYLSFRKLEQNLVLRGP
jgi:hypothetical protein